jgi:hypothetical protein
MQATSVATWLRRIALAGLLITVLVLGWLWLTGPPPPTSSATSSSPSQPAAPSVPEHVPFDDADPASSNTEELSWLYYEHWDHSQAGYCTPPADIDLWLHFWMLDTIGRQPSPEEAYGFVEMVNRAEVDAGWC